MQLAGFPEITRRKTYILSSIKAVHARIRNILNFRIYDFDEVKLLRQFEAFFKVFFSLSMKILMIMDFCRVLKKKKVITAKNLNKLEKCSNF